MVAVAEEVRLVGAHVAAWPARRWLTAAAVALIAGIATGIPTDIVPNPFYVRMTPVLWWNYPVWALSALGLGLIAATYVRDGSATRRASGGALGGGLLSFLAVGCPVCNKLVVAAVGTAGALSFFAPLQPLVAGLGLVLLMGTLTYRLRSLSACRGL